jgi:polysaccharide pyruvyl transferase WcaK-like protein
MKIALCGYYAKNNFGDDMMADCLSEVLSSGGKNSVRVYSDTANLKVYDYKNHSHLDNDIIVIGGGGIVDNKFWALSEDNIDKLKNKKIIFLNVNIYSEAAKNVDFMNKLKSLDALWWVRDKSSVDLLYSSGIASSFLPDVTFKNIVDNKNKTNKKLLNVFLNFYALKGLFDHDNVNNWVECQAQARELASYFDWLTTFGWNIQFVPCQTAFDVDDRLISAYIFGLCKNKQKINWISKPTNWKNIVKIIMDSDLVISQRYHSTAFAVANGIRVVDINHHSKNIEFLKDVGIVQAGVSLKGLTRSNLIEATKYAEHNSNFKNNLNNYKLYGSQKWFDFELEWNRLVDSWSK